MRFLGVLLLGFLLLAASHRADAQAGWEPSSNRTVASNPGQLLRALENGATRVALLAHMTFTPENWPYPPLLVTRAMTLYSTDRIKLDFCGSAGAPARPLFNVTATGSLTLHRVFLRNFLPSVPQDLSGMGPVPALLSSGGRISFNQIVFHILPSVAWAFSAPPETSFWSRERSTPGFMTNVYSGAPLQLDTPALYLLKHSSPQYSFTTCYAPVDLSACYADNAEDATLVYCLYTFADAMRNPHVRDARVFHDVGFDRTVYNPRNPIQLTKATSYTACREGHPSINLDAVMSGVAVRAPLEFAGLRIRGSVPTNFTAWPAALPLLLGALDVDGDGVVNVVSSTVEVPDLPATVRILRGLPGKDVADASRPNLQPTVVSWPSLEELSAAQTAARSPDVVAGGGTVLGAWSNRAFAVADATTLLGPTTSLPGFHISKWDLEMSVWQQYASASVEQPTALEPSSAAWHFQDVRVEQADGANMRTLCFGSPMEQGAVMRRDIAVVADDLQLRAALARAARYIQVVADIRLDPANWRTGSGVLVLDAGIVEVRGCHPVPGKRYTIDLANLMGVVRCSGRLVIQGDLRFTNLYWRALPAAQVLAVASGALDLSPLGAFILAPNRAGGTGALELEGVLLEEPLASSGSGLRPSDMINVLHLTHLTSSVRLRNASLLGSSGIRLGMWSMAEDATQTGTWVFINTDVRWAAVAATVAAAEGDGEGGSSSKNVLAVAIPVAVGGALVLALAVLGVAFVRCKKRCFMRRGTAEALAAEKALAAAEEGEGGQGGDCVAGDGACGDKQQRTGSGANAPSSSFESEIEAVAVGGPPRASTGEDTACSAAPAAAAAARAARALKFAALTSPYTSPGSCFRQSGSDLACGERMASALVGGISVGGNMATAQAPTSTVSMTVSASVNAVSGRSTAVTDGAVRAPAMTVSAASAAALGRAGARAEVAAVSAGNNALFGKDGAPQPTTLLGGVASDDGLVVALASTGPARLPACSQPPNGRERDRAPNQERGPLGDIDAAKRAIAAGRPPPTPSHDSLDDIELVSVLGEGSYGRVYRALWRGTTVAVKVILLPAHMSGRERHERMAVMEAAISSSLSHPNVVQTYTYSVGEVQGAKARGAAMRMAQTGSNATGMHASGMGMVIGAHDSLVGSRNETGSGGTSPVGETAATASDLVGYEIRLVQEFCDHGSLRDKLNARAFFKPAAPLLQPTTSTTAASGLTSPIGATVVSASAAAIAQANALQSAAGSGAQTGSAAVGATSAYTPGLSFATMRSGPVSMRQQPAAGPAAGPSFAPGGAAAPAVGSSRPDSAAAMGCSPSSASQQQRRASCSLVGDNSGAVAAAAGCPPPALVVDLAAVLDTAIDVARAVAHLHREGIVHADLKPRNVLLKGSTHDPRGFVAKVADFGLSMRLDADETHVSNAYHGTLAYMAPETLLNGHVSRASDVYGFGIILYELYTGDTAYRSVPKALLGHAITKDNLRPTFPPGLGAPFEYQLLACRCWESNPEIRPEFEFIVDELKRMRMRLCAPVANAANPAGGWGSKSGQLGGLCGGGAGGNGVTATGAMFLRKSHMGGDGHWGMPQLTAPSNQLPFVAGPGGVLLRHSSRSCSDSLTSSQSDKGDGSDASAGAMSGGVIDTGPTPNCSGGGQANAALAAAMVAHVAGTLVAAPPHGRQQQEKQQEQELWLQEQQQQHHVAAPSPRPAVAAAPSSPQAQAQQRAPEGGLARGQLQQPQHPLGGHQLLLGGVAGLAGQGLGGPGSRQGSRPMEFGAVLEVEENVRSL